MEGHLTDGSTVDRGANAFPQCEAPTVFAEDKPGVVAGQGKYQFGGRQFS